MCKKLIYLIFLAAVLIVAQSASADLVGHWLLDGDGTDASGNGLDGTINGNVAPTIDKFGNPDSAMQFGGASGDNVNIGDPPELRLTRAMTLCAWVVLDGSNTNNARIFAKAGGGGSRSWTLNIEASTGGVTNPATLQLSPDGAVNISLSDSEPLPTDEWVHMAGVYKPGQSMEVYVNGELKVSNTSNIPTSQFSNNNRTVLIGNRHDAGNCGWLGSIDDVRIYDEALTAAAIIQVMIGVPPGAASNPSPADEAPDVPRDVVLKWTPGEFAPAVNGHTVYFSKNFDDINDDIGGIIQSAGSYAPAQRLDFETVYYWRIDEVNAPPDATIFKGDVWSFTTEPEGVPLTSDLITATASSLDNNQIDPNATINRAGLDEKNLHNDEKSAMWLCSLDDPEPWIQYDFDKAYKLHDMKVWNHNSDDELTLGYGTQQARIETSVDGETWTELDSLQTFNQAPGVMDYAANTTVSLGGVIAQSVRITALSNWSPWPQFITQKGLSEVQFSYIPVWARKPDPDSGATDVDVDVTLAWRAGREAATHDVYLSTNQQAVIDGTVPDTVVTEASHSPSPLELGSTYYWRIDEVNDAEIPITWQGDIWSFSTQEYLVVDNFEDYNVGDNEIWFAWNDGLGAGTPGVEPYVPGNGTGSMVGDDSTNSYTEESIVHGGNQSMPYWYDNNKQGFSTYSEAKLTLTNPRDWTANGIQTLSLWFFGFPTNVLGQLYVKINGFKVPYDGDADNLTQAVWQPWNIDLASFEVDLQSVTSLAIGIEGSGAVGKLLFDDIRLYAYERQLITPSDPGNTGLVTHYKLDQNANDSSGNGHNGTVEGAAAWASPGWDGTGACMKFGGNGDRITVESFDVAGSGITLAAWIKPSTFKNDARMLSKSEGSGTADHYWAMVLSGGGENNLQFRLRTDVGGTTSHTSGDAYELVADEWTHVAVAWDAGDPYMRMYKNGREIFSRDKAGSAVATSPGVKIGIGNQSVSAGPVPGDMTRPYDGLMDEVRVYDRGLSVAEITWLAGMTKPFDKPF